ncbi:MAG: hypothetical protein Q4C57_07470, partial [Bacillota bacterium]|nr:hypothetical protein [Bacillota bacterium]
FIQGVRERSCTLTYPCVIGWDTSLLFVTKCSVVSPSDEIIRNAITDDEVSPMNKIITVSL